MAGGSSVHRPVSGTTQKAIIMQTIHPIKITALLGSVRPGNFTFKVLNIVLDELRSIPDVAIDLIDPSTMNLFMPGAGESPDARVIQQRVKDADGIILATPEYHGSYSSVMKLLIENLGFPSELKGKPVALLGAAAGQIGAIKSLEHLRSVASHVGAMVLPGPVSVAHVRTVFNDQDGIIDQGIEKMVRGLATDLVTYVRMHTCPRSSLENIVREYS